MNRGPRSERVGVTKAIMGTRHSGGSRPFQPSLRVRSGMPAPMTNDNPAPFNPFVSPAPMGGHRTPNGRGMDPLAPVPPQNKIDMVPPMNPVPPVHRPLPRPEMGSNNP